MCKDDERFKFLCRWASVQCTSIVHLLAPRQNARYIAAAIELNCDSNSEMQFVSDDSITEASDDLSEDSHNSIPTDQ
jgi:hypothetical protein